MNNRRNRIMAIVVLALAVVGVAFYATGFSPVEWFMKLHGF